MEQEENLCDVVETVIAFTYLGDRASVNGGCEAVVNARNPFHHNRCDCDWSVVR